MPEQEITIKVDIPDGYEATGEFRFPRKGESHLEWPDMNNIMVAGLDYVHKRHIILRKKWQWPEWLKLPYIAMDHNGEWFAFSEKPTKYDTDWDGGLFACPLSAKYFDFTPPECTDWTQSLLKNPNAK